MHEKLNLVGPANSTGYGVHTISMLKALSKLTHLSYFPIGEPQPNIEDVPVINQHSFLNRGWDRNAPSVRIWHEFDHWAYPSEPRIAFPVWELDRISQPAVRQLNNCDLVLVPSQWQADGFVRSGGNPDLVRIVPEGVDPDIFRPVTVLRPDPSDLVKFVHIGKAEGRKNTIAIAQAFSQCMQGVLAKLTMYIWNPFCSENEKAGWIQACSLPGVEVVWQPLGRPEQVASIINRHHAAIYASAAEGWGLPILEAMACGLHVITPVHTGIKEYACPDSVYGVQTRGLVPARDGKFFHGQGQWYRVQVPEIQDQIRHAYAVIRDSKDIVNHKGVEKGQEFSWDNAAKKLMQTI